MRVHVPNNYVLGFWVIVIVVLVLGKYVIIRYLDPQGLKRLSFVGWGYALGLVDHARACQRSQGQDVAEVLSSSC